MASCVQRVSADTWRLDFYGAAHFEEGTIELQATRDCGSVLTQLAKWPLQIESRPPATDIEQRDEKKKKVNVHDITTIGSRLEKKRQKREGQRDRDHVPPRTPYSQ